MSNALPRTDSPEDVGLLPDAVDALVGKLARLVAKGEIPSGQLALARDGKVAVAATFGRVTSSGRTLEATDETLYLGFSTTKAITSAALWLLLQDGKLGLSDPVVDHIPEFGDNDKGEVRIEHLLTHTAGFPSAPLGPLEWADTARRLERFASWTLDWKPGEQFQYHPTSSMWVVAELIERASGCDFRDFIRTRVSDALGLPDLHLGFPEDHPAVVADLVEVGEAPDPEELKAVGLTILEQFTGADASVLGLNRPEVRAVGTPSGGVIANASSLTLFYQALLHGGARDAVAPVWEEQTLREALRDRTGDLVDPMTGRLAHRGLGVVLAGETDRIFRSFAPTNSPKAFGHAGLGGQVAWADPATGISFAFLTNGCDRDPVRMGGRGIALSSAAVACVDESATA